MFLRDINVMRAFYQSLADPISNKKVLTQDVIH
jgi:hypothetical protein